MVRCSEHSLISPIPVEQAATVSVVVVTSIVSGPGWVDQSVNRIRGFYPLSVERYLNAAVGDLAPSVTTVTNVARSYCLHGLVMSETHRRQLDLASAQTLLRRAEVVMSLATIAHAGTSEHPTWMPDPHGAAQLRMAWDRGPVSMVEVTGGGPAAYTANPWGFRNPYVGAETRLGILDRSGLDTAGGYSDPDVRPPLSDALRLASEWESVSVEDAKAAGHLCICRSLASSDGAWLAARLTGDATLPDKVAGTIAATMALVAEALLHGEIGSETDLADFIRFDPRVSSEPALARSPVAARWRGVALRHLAVLAWRELWALLSDRAGESGGFLPVSELQDCLADVAPRLSVGAFLAGLPDSVHGTEPVNGEGGCAGQDLAEPIVHLARILLSGRRAAELAGEVQFGYLGEPGDRDRAQELAPLWVGHTSERWEGRQLPDFCSYLVKLLLDRSQRVALDKAGFRQGRFVLPARVLVRDGFVEWRDTEGAGNPPLRLERILHIGRQVGLFARDEGRRWTLGERGDLLAG